MDKDILLKIELPKGWAKATIGEMISADGVFVDGDWIESKDQDQNGDVRLIQLADIGDGDFRDKSSRFLTLKRAKEIGCTFILEGDILVARMPDPIGRACLFPLKGENKFVTAVDVAIIRTGKESIKHKLLNYFINSPIIRNKIEALQSGTTRKRISRGNLSLIEFPVPPLNEQNRIVEKLDELLSELEKGKEQLQTSLEQLKVYRQSILKHAFEGKLTEEWRKLVKTGKFKQDLKALLNHRSDIYKSKITEAKKSRSPKPRIPKNIDAKFKLNKDLLRFISPIIPESWSVVHLAVISNDEPDSIVDGPFGSSINVQEDYKESGVPVIRINNILPFEFSRNKLKFIRKEKFKTLKRHNVLPGDVLFGKVGTIGNSCVYPISEPEGMLSTTGSCRIRVDEKIVTKEYLCYYLNSQKRAFNEIASAAVQAFLNMETINNFPIPICSIKEQKVIVEELEKEFTICDNLENTLIENLQYSDNLKQSILQKAFEGILVEQDANDEPASLLLKRIKKEREVFLKAKKERKKTEKPLQIKTRKMAKELKRIMEILKESKEPVSAKTLWQSSKHKDDIDDFYATLKKHIEAGEIIELSRKGKESFLKLVNVK